ncbi:MAG: hypothetical protein ACKORB_04000 [Opitutia bacterium]
MIHTYKLYILKRHLFADLPEGRALIDTGAPFTASRTGKVTWGGNEETVKRGGYTGFTFDSLSANIGAQVDILIGLDLLSKQSLEFDLIEDALRLGVPTPRDGSFAIKTMMGMPAVEIDLNGQTASALFDTGAQYGYVMDEKFGDIVRETAIFTDFSPLFGELRPRQVWILPFRLGGQDLDETFGLAPEVMQLALGSFGFDAIIGLSWMDERVTWLDLPGRRMKIGPRN